MNSDSVFYHVHVCFQAAVYAVYCMLFKCYAKGRIINFLMGFSVALITVRLEYPTIRNKLTPQTMYLEDKLFLLSSTDKHQAYCICPVWNI